MAARRQSKWRAGTIVLGVALVVGCSSDVPNAPRIDPNPAHVFAKVRMNYRTVTLTDAPYDTIGLNAVAYDPAGAAIPLDGAHIVYSSSDPVAMHVTPDGLVSANVIGGNAWIKGTITIGNVPRSDSVFVTRLAGNPVVTGLSAALPPSDSAKVRTGSSKAVVTMLTGTGLEGVAVLYELPDTMHIGVNGLGARSTAVSAFASGTGRVSVTVRTKMPGKVWIQMYAHVRGVTWRDSLVFTAGARTGGSYSFARRVLKDQSTIIGVEPKVIQIGVGGTASWTGYGIGSNTPYSIIFDDSSKARPSGTTGPSGKSGNIEPFTFTSFFDASVGRKFVQPGTIRWHSPELNVDGTIIVVDERACLPDCPPIP